MTLGHLDAIRSRHLSAVKSSTFVETGTFKGDRARMARLRYPVVHTIEISRELYTRARDALAPIGVHCHHGDSRALVPALAKQLQGAVTWYLDAHWFDLNRRRTRSGAAEAAAHPVGGRDVGLPLWDELAAIGKRTAPDVIIVDDARDFGTTHPTPEWAAISLDRIASYFPDHKEAVIMGDQAVVYR